MLPKVSVPLLLVTPKPLLALEAPTLMPSVAGQADLHRAAAGGEVAAVDGAAGVGDVDIAGGGGKGGEAGIAAGGDEVDRGAAGDAVQIQSAPGDTALMPADSIALVVVADRRH